MNRKPIYIILIIGIFIGLLFGGIKLYNYIRVKTAKVEIILKDDLTLEFNDKKKVSDYIEKINGKIVDDYEISSTKLGVKKVKFKFINDDNIKLNYTYQVEVVDTTAPLIWLGNNYQVEKGSNIDLSKKILCGDNYDSNPNCFIEGKYDVNKPGNYALTFKAIDQSGNEESKNFTLNVYEPKTDKEKIGVEKKEPVYTKFEDVVKKYKNDNVKIGIDISKWQKDVDFKKLKNAGVEFVIIRVGGTIGNKGKYFLDDKFIQNIKAANKNKIKAGVYFYSYSNSNEQAKKDAKWVIKQIKPYKIDLPVAFDWEEWSSFNEYNLSFFGLTSMADVFLDTIKKAGYQAMLYSSKSYLENIWLEEKYPIWLAHYTDQTNYQGDYKIWQICENGKVDGIDTAVDIDILYEKK